MAKVIPHFKQLDLRFEALRDLFADISGIPVTQVPNHWLFCCRNTEIAEATTIRNAIAVRLKRGLGVAVKSSDLPWSATYNGKRIQMIQALLDEGYLNHLVKISA
jgi:hypothetical protein